MGNNPISRIDPDGGSDCPDPPCTINEGNPIVLDEVIITSGSGNGGSNYPNTWSTELQLFGANLTFDQWHSQNPQFSSIPSLAYDQWEVSYGQEYYDWNVASVKKAEAEALALHLMNFGRFLAMEAEVLTIGFIKPVAISPSKFNYTVRYQGLSSAEKIHGYFGVNPITGKIEYIGITNNPVNRFRAHMRATDGKQFLDFQLKTKFNSRLDARIWEQRNINNQGLNNLLNRRNEIRQSLWSKYGL